MSSDKLGLTEAIAEIAATIYGYDFYALCEQEQSSLRLQIANHHKELLAAMVCADAQFQMAVEFGEVAEALKEYLARRLRA